MHATYDDISDAESKLEDLQRSYLRRFGWTYSSTTPDHSWRWRRTFDDIAYSCDTGDAIRMTRHALDND